MKVNVCLVLIYMSVGFMDGRFLVEEDTNTVVIFSGELKIELWKNPYHMVVYDNTTGKSIVTERSDKGHRLGYGRWVGEYFHIYEGYLWRLGDIVEWYEATSLVSVSYGSNDVTAYIATDDPKNTTIELRLYDLCQRQMSFSFTIPDESMNRVRWTLDTPDSQHEGFYGFGERFNSLDQRLYKVGCWTQDGSFSIGKLFPNFRFPGGESSTYVPMPLFLSTKGYGFQMDTTYRVEFEFSHVYIAEIQIESNIFAATLFGGHNVRDSFNRIIETNGRSLIPPKWAFGPWNQLDDEVAGVNMSQRTDDMLFKYDIPFSMNVNTIHFLPGGVNESQYAQILARNEKLLNMGIPSTAYFNPMVETSYSDTYNEGAAKGYFTKNETGDPYQFLYIAAHIFRVSQVDFTNPDAVTWYQGLLQQGMDLQFKGWMYDYGEYTPSNSVNSLNQSGLESHNEYPLLYQKACFDHLTANNTPGSPYAPDYVYYVRSGYTGSQKYTWAHWTGDPSTDWSQGSGMIAQMRGSLNIGISGMPFSGSDIGGYEWYTNRAPSLELWVRWTQLGAFSGLMHEQGGGKGIGAKTHIFDTPVGTQLWRKFAKLRTQLFPYIYTQAHTAHETGLPLMRAHILEFYDDPEALLPEDQYMFGDSILVAPILNENWTGRTVYLPKGETWIDISSNMTYDESDGRFRIGQSEPLEGGKFVTISAPLDTIPLLVRAGSIIPAFDPRVQVLRTAPHPNVTGYDEIKTLYLWVWPTSTDSSSGHDWQDNTFSTSPMSSSVGKGFDVALNVTSANYDTVICQIAINGGRSVNSVTVVGGGSSLTEVSTWQAVVDDAETAVGAWTFDTQRHILWIKVSTKPIVINALYTE
ncbi:sulfoquinovosidase-like [Haliotis rubra]|uniref:sulfoquinovosidase-like n=1 Tax=Haliotis rubra TaxID=36100 RepID=UPI001EE5DBDF|nr:sulfoquinovosidase-like [Haliotis rubra]